MNQKGIAPAVIAVVLVVVVVVTGVGAYVAVNGRGELAKITLASSVEELAKITPASPDRRRAWISR